MRWTDPISKALELSNGACFYRCALQVNPHHYAESYRGKTHGLDEDNYVGGLIAKCTELGINVIAITDHNHVGSIDHIRGEAKRNDIYVFPGFEISSAEGVHILCIYPPDTPTATLSRYLGEFGIRGVGPSTTLANKPIAEILSCVKEQGGVSIAAHVTQDNGLLNVLQGQARINAWKDKNLLAVQIPGAVDDVPNDKCKILRNQDPAYKRIPAVASNLAIAAVNAKDVTKPEELGDPSATCWIKMSEITVEGLRQAFLDPTSSIRLAKDPIPEDHSEFVAMAWEGGFLDGSLIHFNENMNVLIGGRGTGKSTVIESIRYAMGLEPLGEEAQKANEGIIQQVLRGGTKVSLLVRSHRPTKREYLIERTVPNPPIVRDDMGKVLTLTPSDVAPRAEVYGQHEISELTKSPDKLTRLLERFIGRAPGLTQRKSDLIKEMERSRSRILEVKKELNQIDERLATLPSLEETLKRFQEAGLEKRLKEQSLLVREERILRTANERIAPFRDILLQLRRGVPIDRAFLSAKAVEGLPGKEILSEADAALDQFDKIIIDAIDRIEKGIEKADAELASIRQKWEARKMVVQADYEKILRELQKSKVDGEEFIQLRHRIEDLRPLKEREAALQRDLKELEDQRRNFLAEWADIKTSEYQQLDRAAKKVNKALAERVQVRVISEGNREPLFQLFRKHIRGHLIETINILNARPSLSLKDFADDCRAGRDTLITKYAITQTQAERLAQAPLETIMEIEELELPSITHIELNVAGEKQPPVWQALEDLSKGQKATAVLLLLLLESDAPLVVDQPEDDLDNRFITDGIVPKMREEKRRRQFLFSTHNANIPVLGAAELIVGLTAAGEAEQGKAEISANYMGSIDARPVRELVEEVLEGGKAAFEIRRLKYGY